jgi:hypothetical protein
MTNHVRLFGRASVCLAARCATLSLAMLAGAAAFGQEKPRSVARVVKLTHLAVILPESVVPIPAESARNEARPKWRIEEMQGMGVGPPQPASRMQPERGWNPTVEQVAAAENAIVQRLKELAKSGCTLPLNGSKIDVKAKYVIQYYGVDLEHKRWIKCYIINAELLREMATTGSVGLAEELEDVFTHPILVFDCPWVFDTYYDPATNKLSESMGMFDALRPGKVAPGESSTPEDEPAVDDPFQAP